MLNTEYEFSKIVIIVRRPLVARRSLIYLKQVYNQTTRVTEVRNTMILSFIMAISKHNVFEKKMFMQRDSNFGCCYFLEQVEKIFFFLYSGFVKRLST